MNRQLDKWETLLRNAIAELKETGKYRPYEELRNNYIRDDARAWIRKCAQKRLPSNFAGTAEHYIKYLEKEIKYYKGCLDACRCKF